MSDQNASAHREELLVLYQVTVADLAYFKSTQWTVTNYAVLLLAAVAGLRQVVGADIMPLERAGLSVLACIIGAAGLAMLFKLEQSIRVRETRLDAVRENLSAEFNAAWRAGAKGAEYFRSIWFLRGAIIIGATIVIWICERA